MRRRAPFQWSTKITLSPSAVIAPLTGGTSIPPIAVWASAPSTAAMLATLARPAAMQRHADLRLNNSWRRRPGHCVFRKF